MKDILVIGSVNIDYSVDCDWYPSLGETVKGRNFDKNIGGKGLNQAVAAYKFNGSVKFCGSVGNDQDAELVFEAMKDIGVSNEYLYRSQDTSTGIAIVMRADSDNAIVISEGANGRLPFENVKKIIDSIGPSYVVMQMELPILLTKEILNYCSKSQIKVIINTAPAVKLEDEDFKNIDTIILNQTETKFYTNILPIDNETTKEATNYFIEKGVRNVIVTLGSEGSYFTDGIKHIRKKAISTNVVDTTGAGDAFVGVYVSALNEFESIEKALTHAGIAGSLACEKIGATSASPSRKEIEDKLMEEK